MLQVSEYVRSVVAKTPWHERSRVQYLFELEKIARGETRTWGWVYNAYVRPQRMKEHWADYLKILDEVDPNWRELERQAWQEEYERRRREYLDTERRGAATAVAEERQQRELWARTGQPVPDLASERAVLVSEDEFERYFTSRGIRPPWTPSWTPGTPHARR